ncbi:preprotein translocase subunit SecG, partial [Mesorhizobium sp. M2D.F.Ca.ET.145.01.1.1]
ANALTRATAILAAAFFVTSLTLSIIARYGEKPIDILDRVPVTSDGAGKGVLNQLPGTTTPAPAGTTTPTPPSGNDAAAKPPATAPATAPAAGSTPPATNGTTNTAPAAPQVPNQ